MKFFKKNANLIITLLFFGLLGWYFINNREALSSLMEVPFWVVLLLLVMKGSRIFITGLFTKFTLDAFGKKMTYGEVNYLSLLSSIGNFFGPILGGASIRAVYLKKKHDFEYSKFISTLYGFYIVTFLTNALIGLLLVINYGLKVGGSTELWSVAAVFLFIFLANLALVAIPAKVLHKIVGLFKFLPKRLIKITDLMIGGWETIRVNHKLLFKLFLLNIAITSVIMVESTVLYYQFVDNWQLTSVLLYTILGTLSTLVSVTPGAVGVKEAIFLFSASVTVLAPEQILQMATVDRSATFLLLIISYAVVKLFSLKKKA
jgi:uncharacterized membrane protein YbhN (UPF0104 family)